MVDDLFQGLTPQELTFENGAVTLRAVAAGKESGPVVILLHGFPEYWYGWRKQIEPLAAAGFRVVVPDQRGYNRSSKPSRVRDYSMRYLVADVLCMVEQLGRERVFLVGHDWGAFVAWCFAARHPERVERLVIINVPHPRVMQRFLLTRPRQLLRSWYVFFFQIPRLPEMLFAAGAFKAGVLSLVKSSRSGTFSPGDLERYREAWAQPGAVTGMVNWYRALVRRPFAFQAGPIQVPTLVVWGKRDAFLLPFLAQASVRQCQDGSLLWFENATHWVHHEEAAAVNDALLGFFSTSDRRNRDAN